jgi:hypothetical protein
MRSRRLIVGVIGLLIGLLFLALSLAPQPARAFSVSAGYYEPLTNPRLSTTMLVLSWSGLPPGTTIFVVSSVPTRSGCSDPTQVVAWGAGSWGSLAFSQDASVTDYVYGCSGSSAEAVSLNMTQSGGVTPGEIVAGTLILIDLLILVVGFRRSKRSPAAASPAEPLPPPVGYQVPLAAPASLVSMKPLPSVPVGMAAEAEDYPSTIRSEPSMNGDRSSISGLGQYDTGNGQAATGGAAKPPRKTRTILEVQLPGYSPSEVEHYMMWWLKTNGFAIVDTRSDGSPMRRWTWGSPIRLRPTPGNLVALRTRLSGVIALEAGFRPSAAGTVVRVEGYAVGASLFHGRELEFTPTAMAADDRARKEGFDLLRNLAGSLKALPPRVS